jgi:hypothetical protein
MRSTSALRDQVRNTFVPFVRAAGFDAASRRGNLFMEFRRDAGPVVHVLETQWEKYGRPRFVINYGTCPSSGIDVQGKHFTPADVCAGWLPDSGRLRPGRGATTASWFRQDYPLLKQLLFRRRCRAASDVVAEAVHLFAELEAYWRSGTLGTHMRAVPPAAIRDPGSGT